MVPILYFRLLLVHGWYSSGDIRIFDQIDLLFFLADHLASLLWEQINEKVSPWEVHIRDYLMLKTIEICYLLLHLDKEEENSFLQNYSNICVLV
jgi:hypothetical protein